MTAPGEAQRFYRDVVLPYEGDDCLFWPYSKWGRGYGHVWADGRQQYVHVLVCREANGPAPTPKHEAAHSCGKGHLGCCARKHLSWKTRSENHADKITHGTMLRGDTHPRSKLTEQNVMQARAMARSHTHDEIAEKFGVARATVSLAVAGVTWAHLDGAIPVKVVDPDRSCSIEGCSKKSRKLGMCVMHYWRVRNWGHAVRATETTDERAPQ